MMSYKIGFVGFQPGFTARSYGLVRLLEERFDLEIVDAGEVPHFLFFSVYEYPHRDPRYDRCTKIFTSEENIRIPWGECDYAVTGDHVVGRSLQHLRIPIYAKSMEEHDTDLLKRFDVERTLTDKKKFCTFVVSCPYARHREIFFEELSKYKRVDSGGRWLNNVGGPVDSKLEFIRDSKFNVAFENSRFPGYVTEKIVESMVAGCVPIYWGDRWFGREFNRRSVVDANEPDGCCLGEDELRRHFQKVVEEVASLDSDDNAYLEKLSEPWLHCNEPLPWPEQVAPFFRRVFEAGPSDYWRSKDSHLPLCSWKDLEGRDWMMPGYWGARP